MIEDEKKPGIDPVIIFLLISVVIHGLLFYLIPKLNITLPKPKNKSEKPISVQLIDEPVKGEKKPPKKASVLGKENITVKKETRPEDKPKTTGEKKMAKLLPPPPPPVPPIQPPKPKVEEKKPEIKLTPLPKKAPTPPKKEVKPKPKPKPAPKKEVKKPKPLPKPEKPKAEKFEEKIITTPKKAKVKIAKPKPVPKPKPKKKVAPKKVEKRPAPAKKPLTPAPPKVASKATKTSPSSGPPPGVSKENKARTPAPVPSPKSLFPSVETLHQIERKFSHTYPKDVEKGDVISLNTKDFRYTSYFTHIKRKIELVWEYPRRAAEMGQEGSLLLRFTILKDGRLGGIKLLQSSGYRLLDQEAIRAVREAAPFNPIPDRLHKNRLNIMATFNYSLGFKFVY